MYTLTIENHCHVVVSMYVKQSLRFNSAHVGNALMPLPLRQCPSILIWHNSLPHTDSALKYVTSSFDDLYDLA